MTGRAESTYKVDGNPRAVTNTDANHTPQQMPLHTSPVRPPETTVHVYARSGDSKISVPVHFVARICCTGIGVSEGRHMVDERVMATRAHDIDSCF